MINLYMVIFWLMNYNGITLRTIRGMFSYISHCLPQSTCGKCKMTSDDHADRDSDSII